MEGESTGTVNIPGGDTTAAVSDPHYTGRQGMSSTPYSESPTSFHTADQLDNDYQQDVIAESPPSTPPSAHHRRFYSDGRPRPPSHNGDDESRDSLDEGGYITATQIPAAHRFTDPDQPKLLLAEDSVQPLTEKRPLHDDYSPSPTTGQVQPPRDPNQQGGAKRRGGSRQRREAGGSDEQTPLLSSRDRDEESSSCCTIL